MTRLLPENRAGAKAEVCMSVRSLQHAEWVEEKKP